MEQGGDTIFINSEEKIIDRKEDDVTIVRCENFVFTNLLGQIVNSEEKVYNLYKSYTNSIDFRVQKGK